MFADRRDAGRRLAAGLVRLAGRDVVVLGLPRGGVPVADEIARALGAPLDVIVVRKLGLPFQPEVAMGAIGEGGVEVLDHGLIARAGVSRAALAAVERRERAVLEDRLHALRRGAPAVSLEGRIAVIVDDGIATGATARAACQVARRRGASTVVVAAPVVPAGLTAAELAADDLVAYAAPLDFRAVGQYYQDFTATSDEEVAAVLAGSRRDPSVPTSGEADADVDLDLGSGLVLQSHLRVPPGAAGVVVFAHGSGSSRFSTRNQYVAEQLGRAGLATLLLDLLTPAEEGDRSKVFDIPLLADRLHRAGSWALAQPGLTAARLGYFGASTGAGAALWAAALPDSRVEAIVSRGGRPDLAADRLPRVHAPTLLIVGGRDGAVLDLNRQAQARLRCPSRLVVVPGATHLFEEPGALEEVAGAASAWFLHHLSGASGWTSRRTP